MQARVPPLTIVLLGLGCLLTAGEASAEAPYQAVQAKLSVTGVRLTDNGDNDGFADPDETVQLYVTLRNVSGSDRTGIVVRMASTAATVGCIPTPIVSFGSLLAGEVREAMVPLVLRVTTVTRTDPFQDLSIPLEFVISGDDFGTTKYPQQVTLDVDLNVSGGFLPSTYTEGFENAGFGSFTTQTLDLGRESLTASNGFRCQYNDPDFINSNSYGSTFCYLGAPTAAQNAYDWHVHTLTAPDGGRAYLGNNSLHWGVHAGAAGMDTTRLRQLDAIRTTLPINLGWNGVTPELSFKHQVGLTDAAGYPGEIADRGIVQVQLANSAGLAVGSWRKIAPYENIYDSQAVDNYAVCIFDPTDDGNTEDDFFDPADPYRRVGPSSTCFPEFAFSRQGAIFYTAVFDVNAVGLAEGPGLQGSRGPGTWVQPKFDLHRWRGRRLRLRFLATSMELTDNLTWQQASGWNPTDLDDGWYIDDIRVTNTLTSAATVSVDTADRTGLPVCGPVCTDVTSSLVAPPIVSCDEPFVVDASGSAADRCPGGVLQYRFWGNWLGQSPSSALNVGNAEMLQDWSENGAISQVIEETVEHPLGWFPPRRFGVDVRCSTLPACEASASAASVDLRYALVPFPYTIRFIGATVLSWGTSTRVDALRGDLHALRANGGNFNGTVASCLLSGSVTSSLADLAPSPGEAWYYLVRETNVYPGCTAYAWTTGAPSEVPGLGGGRDDDIALDPDHCPDPWE